MTLSHFMLYVKRMAADMNRRKLALYFPEALGHLVQLYSTYLLPADRTRAVAVKELVDLLHHEYSFLYGMQ